MGTGVGTTDAVLSPEEVTGDAEMSSMRDNNAQYRYRPFRAQEEVDNISINSMRQSGHKYDNRA